MIWGYSSDIGKVNLHFSDSSINAGKKEKEKRFLEKHAAFETAHFPVRARGFSMRMENHILHTFQKV